MASSKAKTVAAYLKELPADRRATISAVRDVILKHLPKGYEEVMAWGMICYEVPLATLPDTYNGQPLVYAGLAAQKNYNSLYLGCEANYLDPKASRADKLAEAFRTAGKKLNCGKGCVRFQRVDDLPLKAIGEIIGSTSVKDFVGFYRKLKQK